MNWKMNHKWLALSLVASLAVTVTAWSQPPEGGPRGRGGPGRPPLGKVGGPMMKFQAGTVIPPHVREEMELTEEQSEKIEALQAEVKKKLEKILTEKQLDMFGRPPFMPGFGGPGGPPEGPGRGFEGRGRGPGGPPDFSKEGPGPRRKGAPQRREGEQVRRPGPPEDDHKPDDHQKKEQDKSEKNRDSK